MRNTLVLPCIRIKSALTYHQVCLYPDGLLACYYEIVTRIWMNLLLMKGILISKLQSLLFG